MPHQDDRERGPMPFPQSEIKVEHYLPFAKAFLNGEQSAGRIFDSLDATIVDMMFRALKQQEPKATEADMASLLAKLGYRKEEHEDTVVWRHE